jgi:hypothetical protein
MIAARGDIFARRLARAKEELRRDKQSSSGNAS